MGPLDIILILIIAAVFALALRRTLKKKGSCGCGYENCGGACASCGMRGSCVQHKNNGEAPDQTPGT